uniref:CCHC-type domain-containing protein n=1 Tax=Phytophthora ramorum TaxID=164328 RepID=H3GXJ6_PHYRM
MEAARTAMRAEAQSVAQANPSGPASYAARQGTTKPVRMSVPTFDDYVMELQNLEAAMAGAPLSEDVKVTAFMDGVRSGPVRTELFRRQPTTFNDAVHIAMLEDHCVRSAQGYAGRAEATEDPSPMQISSAESARPQRNQRASGRCFGCNQLGHFRRNCPTNPWKTGRGKAAPSLNVIESAVSENGDSQSVALPPPPPGEQVPGTTLLCLSVAAARSNLVVVTASVKGYDEPLKVLIDSGASYNFATKASVARNNALTKTSPLSTGRVAYKAFELRQLTQVKSLELVLAQLRVVERGLPLRKAFELRQLTQVKTLELGLAHRHPSDRVVGPTVLDVLTGEYKDGGGLAILPTVAELLELEELSYVEFVDSLKVGELEEMVLIRRELDSVELNTSSVMDPEVLEDERTSSRQKRYGAAILKDPSDPYYPLLKEFSDVVSDNPPSVLPPDRGVRHEIDLVPGTKYCTTRQWPLPKEQVDVIDAFFAAKYAAGMVRESKSPHSSPTFCVRKPNGKWRMVHAFNKLNAATIPASTPISRKDVLQNNMAGCTIFSALDMVDGYYQLLMRESDVPLTAVSTPSRMLWEWLVMPQGLSNAPATFNRLVTQLFRPMRQFVQTYFDDIFVHTRASGVPVNQKDLCKWLGLANYLHKYSANNAEMARPLTNLLKKEAEL